MVIARFGFYLPVVYFVMEVVLITTWIETWHVVRTVIFGGLRDVRPAAQQTR